MSITQPEGRSEGERRRYDARARARCRKARRTGEQVAVRCVCYVGQADPATEWERLDRQRSLSRGRLVALCHPSASSSGMGRIWRYGADLRGLPSRKVQRESGPAGAEKGLWQRIVRSKMGTEGCAAEGVRGCREK